MINSSGHLHFHIWCSQHREPSSAAPQQRFVSAATTAPCTPRERNSAQQSETIHLFTLHKTGIITYHWWKQSTKWNQGNTSLHCKKATTKLYLVGVGFCSQLHWGKCAVSLLNPSGLSMMVLYIVKIHSFIMIAFLSPLHAQIQLFFVWKQNLIPPPQKNLFTCYPVTSSKSASSHTLHSS